MVNSNNSQIWLKPQKPLEIWFKPCYHNIINKRKQSLDNKKSGTMNNSSRQNDSSVTSPVKTL